MKRTKSIKGFFVMGAIIVISFYFHVDQGFAAQEGQNRRGGPPQEAIDACKSSNEGDSCNFETPRGSLSGSCISVKEGIVCAPKDAPQRSSGNERREGPPQEAIDACNSSSEGKSCSFEAPHGTVSGSCISVKEGLVCAPKDSERGNKGNRGSKKQDTQRR